MGGIGAISMLLKREDRSARRIKEQLPVRHVN